MENNTNNLLINGGEKSTAQPLEIYLVDTENPGSCVAGKLLNEGMKNREIYYFYTALSIRLSFPYIEKLMDYKERIHFERCINNSKNALDFQLISQMGYMLSQYPKETTKFIVVSNDKGFDAAIEFWKRKGYMTERMGGDASIADEYLSNETPVRDTSAKVIDNHKVSVWPSPKDIMDIKNNAAEAAETKSEAPEDAKPAADLDIKTTPEQKIIKETQEYLIEVAETSETDIFAEKTSKIVVRVACPEAARMTKARYERACQIMASQLGTIFKKKKIKCKEIFDVASFMLCNIDYTLDDLKNITNESTANQIFQKINKSAIAGCVLIARKKSL